MERGRATLSPIDCITNTGINKQQRQALVKLNEKKLTGLVAFIVEKK